MIEEAFAMGPSAGADGGGGFMGAMLPFLLMFLILYFLLIRPQQKRQKKHQVMLDELKNGDRVVTSGGLIGTVSGLKADVVVVKIADNVKVEVQRGSISKVLGKKGEKQESEQ